MEISTAGRAITGKGKDYLEDYEKLKEEVKIKEPVELKLPAAPFSEVAA